MTLRSPTEYEMEGPLPTVLPSTRHSRARGNPGLFPAVSLDTRFRGYDVTQVTSSDRLGRYFQRRSLCVSA